MNEDYGMNPTTTFHDAIRFESEEDAINANEVYKVEYSFPSMIVTDPDGKKTILPMVVRPSPKINYKDSIVLLGFFDEDMPKRH